ncbi:MULTISPECIES: pyridoxamine 5'-phosphate oxidase family protein [unclassified Shewanella]|uniref:pyridoxamine 5'-phosphate oxidase family protein n=1 Tax=unclassified Shewanella TaxID=196818 RepID=UPI000C7B46C4|nr:MULTISPECIES: pyridoxamine 5'-phosphate oxidase family protein [unclassified Shewanella]PKG56473.1 flavin-nucleotide-binding protein [Shewanella sp. GutDb-MelDb]PKG76652.1 flavin-nucleotide-binding protein [Shewanella sp. GutCb]
MDNELAPSWHKGEIAVQQRAGTDKRMAAVGPKFIRQFMPQQHRDFYQSQSMIFIGYSDHQSDICASVLFGSPGFIQSPSEVELVINTQQSLGDVIGDNLSVGDRIGLLGIQFDTKRRNRINGIITDVTQKYIRVEVLQSFGNCPKYIQPKKFAANRHYGEFAVDTRAQLSETDRQLITGADTFFIASSFNDGERLNNRGADISHRGGSAGFVSINAAGQLLVPDYVGNGFFNTLGNLLENPTASLLFCDWQQGGVLQITVTSEIIWHDETSPAERTLCFTPIKVEQIANGLAYIEAIPS